MRRSACLMAVLLAMTSVRAAEPARVPDRASDAEPAVQTSPDRTPPATPSSAPAPQSAPAAGSSPSAPPAAAAPANTSSPTPTGARGSADRIELDATQITGNAELPRVLYVVPWKRPELGELGGRPAKSLLDEVLEPVDRDVFRRQNRYYEALRPDGTKDQQ